MTYEKTIFSLINRLGNINYQSKRNFHCGHNNTILYIICHNSYLQHAGRHDIQMVRKQ